MQEAILDFLFTLVTVYGISTVIAVGLITITTLLILVPVLIIISLTKLLNKNLWKKNI